MKLEFGIDMPVPPVSGQVSAERVVEWIVMAEDAGWDGFTFWDHMTFYPETTEVVPQRVKRQGVASHGVSENLTPWDGLSSRRSSSWPNRQ